MFPNPRWRADRADACWRALWHAAVVPRASDNGRSVNFLQNALMSPIVHMTTWILGLFCCWLLSSAGVPAQEAQFDIYVLMGQSNMAGRGEITQQYRAQEHPEVYMLNKELEWVRARHPLHFDKPKIAGVGLGLAFGIAMAEADPDKKIGLVPCAVGGTRIAQWKPGAFDETTRTHPYDDAVRRIREAMKHGTVKGILWHQGEGDRKSAAAYLPQLIELIGRLRTVTQNDKLPFVAGELGRYMKSHEHFNTVIADLPARTSNTAVVSSEGLTHTGDGTHFDSDSLHELGKRYAQAMARLLNEPVPE